MRAKEKTRKRARILIAFISAATRLYCTNSSAAGSPSLRPRHTVPSARPTVCRVSTYEITFRLTVIRPRQDSARVSLLDVNVRPWPSRAARRNGRFPGTNTLGNFPGNASEIGILQVQALYYFTFYHYV